MKYKLVYTIKGDFRLNTYVKEVPTNVKRELAKILDLTKITIKSIYSNREWNRI